MGQNIKNFKGWKNLSESSWADWENTLSNLGKSVTKAVTGYSEPNVIATLTKDSPPKANLPDTAKTTSTNTTKGSNRTYSPKLQKINAKLGVQSAESTVDLDSKIFIDLDLSDSSNVQLYAKLCQEWIDLRKPLAAKVENPISGMDFAEAAELVFNETGVYIPPQLVLAQATLEGGFGQTANKPIRTKNIFNVGNTDGGATKSFDSAGKSLPGGDAKSSWKGGIVAYFKLLSSSYLVPGQKTADDLVFGEFTNIRGNRYASSKSYESGLLKIIDEINTKLIV